MVRVDYCHTWSRSLDKHALLYPPGMGWRAGGWRGHLLPLEAINAKIKCNFLKLRFSDFIYFLFLGVIFYILFYINYKVPYYKGMVTKVSTGWPVCNDLQQGSVNQVFRGVFLMFWACLDHKWWAKFHLGIRGCFLIM